MGALRWCVCAAVLAGGCSRGPQAAADPEAPDGPGRFAHSAIRSTVGPADGATTLLILAEGPVADPPASPHVNLGLHGFPHHWSGKSARIDTGDLATGWATYYLAEGSVGERLAAAAVRFGTVADGRPVEGEYDLTFADGSRARGRFRANWLPREGPGR